MNGIPALITETPESSLVSSTPGGYTEKEAISEPGTWPSLTPNLRAP